MNTCCVDISDFVLVWEVKSRRKRRAQCQGSAEPQEDEEQVIQEESRSEKRKAQLARWRDKFIQNLQNAGLLLEKVYLRSIIFVFRTCTAGTWLNSVFCCCFFYQEESSSVKKTIHYLKLSAPWEVLVYYAEELCLRAPLQVSYFLLPFLIYSFLSRSRCAESQFVFLQAQPHPDFNTSARVLQKLWVPNIMADSVPNRPVDYYTCAFRRSKMEKWGLFKPFLLMCICVICNCGWCHL